MRKLDDFAPAGRDVQADLSLYGIGLACASIFSLAYFAELWSAHYDIVHDKVEVMRPFAYLTHWTFALFPLLAILCLGFIVVYYQMHFGTAKTMYTMRRLPDRWSLHRRCLALPVATAVLTMVVAAVLFLLYYLIYLAVTPTEYMVENQFGILIDAWFHDVPEWKWS